MKITNRLTVGNLIEELSRIEDKELFVVIDNGSGSKYFLSEVYTKMLHDSDEEIKDVMYIELRSALQQE